MILRSDGPITTEELLLLAAEAGFTRAHPLAMEALEFLPEVREMCREDKCRSYDRCWSCPPACGSLERIRSRASAYRRGILVQTTMPMEDEFDQATIREAMEAHQQHFSSYVRQVRMLFPSCLPMGAGACRKCRKCTYPDRPCRHPKDLYPSMEAYGLLVSRVCEKSGLGYYYGPKTMTYTSCVLID